MTLLFKRSFFGFFLLLVYSAGAQVYNPLAWKFSQKKISDSEYVIKLHVDIQKGWHTFEQHTDSNGPIAMAFTFTPDPDYILEGKTIDEDSCITKFDSTFKVIVKYYLNKAGFSQKIIVHSPNGFTLKGNVYCQVCNESMCLPPKPFEFSIKIPPTTSAAGSGYLWIFILGFLGGLAALITPCVFPMIPLTVSFFTKRASAHNKRKSSGPYLYALSIILIYVILGGLITAIAGPSGLYVIASNGWVNLIFFIIFLVFGFSFLGAFEIALPSSWVNKTDKASERGGLMGIFFMALTLCIVSFSCTGPILGSLLAGVS
jgi:thiol:disulfide interchange protein DsbD